MRAAVRRNLHKHYKNGVNDRLIDSTELKKELSGLRRLLDTQGKDLGGGRLNREGKTISQASMSKWRFVAGVCDDLGLKNPDGTTKFSAAVRRKITQKEAVSIILLALWDPFIKELTGSKTAIKAIEAGEADIAPLFNAWMSKLDDPDAQDRMERIGVTEDLTQWQVQGMVDAMMDRLKIRELKGGSYSEARKQAARITGKEVPLSTMRDWVRKAGGKYRKDDHCPMEIAMRVMAFAKASLRIQKTRGDIVLLPDCWESSQVYRQIS
jgi:hypothetical protein